MTDQNIPAPPISRFKIHLLLTAMGTIGITAIFLQFSWGESPWTVLRNVEGIFGTYTPFAWPFALSLPVTLASAHWLISGKLSMPERVFAYLLGAVSAALTVSVYFMADIFPDGVLEWISFIAPCFAAAFGVYVLLGIRKSQSPAIGSYGAIALMQTAYLANCLLCLSSFFGAWQVGAYCSLATAVIYIIQMAIVRGHNQHAGR